MIMVHSSFLPPSEYINAGVLKGGWLIDLAAHFVKQTPRNRCLIAGPNGTQYLIVPVKDRNKKKAMLDVQVSYDEDWRRQHLHALSTAYQSAPYYEYLFPELEDLYHSAPESLIEWNSLFFDWVLNRLNLNLPVNQTTIYQEEAQPHAEGRKWKFETEEIKSEYPQVFQERHGFQPNCSVLDRMMNQLEDFEVMLARQLGF